MQITKRLFVPVIALIFLVFLGSRPDLQSGRRGWTNSPSPENHIARPVEIGTALTDQNTDDYSILVAITISGGGVRAASLAYGVLQAMNETEVGWGTKKTSLLKETDLISGVSGGSILATYYALNGDNTFTSFRDRFLYQNFQWRIIKNIFFSPNAYHLSSPWFGRSDIAMEVFDELFSGKTFADLPVRPRLLISATDLATSLRFPFNKEQFDMICSDLRSVPLSFAVTASSSVPLLFSPLTLQNFNASNACSNKVAPIVTRNKYASERLQHLYDAKRDYTLTNERPYIHLVDGAVSDNLGIRSLLDRALLGKGVRSSVRTAPPHSIRRIIFISINAEKTPDKSIDKTDSIPNAFDVIDALSNSKGLQESNETSDMLSYAAVNWKDELKSWNDPTTPFAADSQLHVIRLGLGDIKNPIAKSRIMSIPTTLSLPRDDVDFLIETGAHLLRKSADYQALLRSFHGESKGQGPEPATPNRTRFTH